MKEREKKIRGKMIINWAREKDRGNKNDQRISYMFQIFKMNVNIIYCNKN